MSILKPITVIDKSQEYFYTKEWQEKVKKSEEDYKKGHYKTFKSADALIKEIKKKIR